jgi:predicted methyltransferase
MIPDSPQGFQTPVLIANTYHELTEPMPILRRLADSLKPGGSLVIVDRGPRSGPVESREKQEEHHELRPDSVETEVRNAGFEIISRQDHFIDRPADDQIWWLLPPLVAGRHNNRNKYLRMDACPLTVQ